MPGTTTPEPSPFVQVVLHAVPAASITEMCVVEPSRREEALEEARVREALEELRRALGLRRGHRVDDALQRRRRGPAVEQPERVREQRAARGGRRVGEDLAIAVAHLHRLALDRVVAGEVRRA